MENKNYVVCPYCQKKLRQINLLHLRVHNKTIKDLKKEFENTNLTCQSIRDKQSKRKKEKIVSEETRKKIGLTSKGKQTFLGKKHSQETKDKISKDNTGKKRSKRTKEQMGKNRLSKKHTLKTCQKIREANIGKKHTKESRLKMSKSTKNGNHPNPMYGKNHSQETKRKMRVSAIKHIENQKGQVTPRYNLKSQDYFREFDKKNNTNGRFAEKGGEYRIKKLGYFPDYINFNLKLIMEWDEEDHFTFEGKLKEKDIQRQKEIQEFFPDFEFRRIRETEYLKRI